MIRPLLHCDSSVYVTTCRAMSRKGAIGGKMRVRGRGNCETYSILNTTPLQRKKQANNTRNKHRRPREVQLLQLIPQRRLGKILLRRLHHKRNHHQRDGSKRQVDIEAPPPGNLCRERAAQQRSDNGSDTKDGPESALILGAAVQRDGVDHDDNGAREDARAADARDGTADYEGGAVGRGTAHGGADLEKDDGAEENALDGEEDVELAKEELEGAGCQEVGASVPAYVGDGVKVICDLGDCCGDDEAVLLVVLVSWEKGVEGP